MFGSKFRPERHRSRCCEPWSEHGRLRCKAPALGGGKWDAQMGAQVCPLLPQAAPALCGHCCSARKASPLLSSRIPSVFSGSQGRYSPRHTQSPQENLTKQILRGYNGKAARSSGFQLPGLGSWIKGECSFKSSFLLRSLGVETGHW